MLETTSKPTRRFECRIKQILGNKVTEHAMDSFGSGQGQVTGCCIHSSATEHKLFKNLRTKSKFQMQEGWHDTSFALRTHKC